MGAFHHAQRINVSALVTAVTVGRDQVLHTHLLSFVDARDFGRDFFRTRLETVAAQALKMLNNLRTRGIRTDSAFNSRQGIKVAAPCFRNVAWICQIFLIEGFYVGSVLSTQM